MCCFYSAKTGDEKMSEEENRSMYFCISENCLTEILFVFQGYIFTSIPYFSDNNAASLSFEFAEPVDFEIDAGKFNVVEFRVYSISENI
jgi:hypothetical protein